MRALLTLLAMLALTWSLPAQEKTSPGKPDDLDGYISENKAKSVRPPKPREVRKVQRDDKKDDNKKEDRKKEDKKKEEKPTKVFSPDDVAALLAMKGKEVTVRGRVASVYVPKSEALVILNFGPDHKTCFKAVVFKRNFDKFEGGMEGLKKLARKTVTVEGTVTEYEGAPQIQLNVPSQLRTDR
jgi:hypothetical protein